MGKYPVGEKVNIPLPCKMPDDQPIVGKFVELVRLKPEQQIELYECFKDMPKESWTYLFDEKAETEKQFQIFFDAKLKQDFFYIVKDKSNNKICGILSYMRVKPTMAVIEIGNIHFHHSMQKSVKSTETIYLMIKNAFENLGYRRVEWKCNNLNELSKKSAIRFGFKFEGIFYNHMIIKGFNRDTAWFAMLKDNWNQIKSDYERWLNPSNFDETGKQKSKLDICY